MIVSRITCPKCSIEFAQEPKFIKHLLDVHNISDHELLYVELMCSGTYPTCQCSQTCDEKIQFYGWKKGFVNKFVRGHNARLDSVYHDKNRQQQFANKRLEGYKSGKYQIWSKGQNSESNSIILNAAIKTSKTLLTGYASGRYKVRSTRKQTTANRLTHDEIEKRIQSSAPNFTLISSIENYTSRQKHRFLVKCNTCNSESEKTLEMLEVTPRCFACNPVSSYPEIQVLEFVKSLVPDEEIISGSRKIIAPQELDIYVPSKLFAIEFNGLTFHTEDFVGKDYHSLKTAKCIQKGISLMHIFSDEWRDKTDIVKSMIKNRLGVIQTSIGARKLRVVMLSPKLRKQFFDENHIDGDVKSKISWGLTTNDNEIIAALSLREFGLRSKKKYEDAIELARFCVKMNGSSPGSLSRLLSHAKNWSKVNNYKRIISYVDLRYGVGKAYEKVGFIKTSQTPNRFWWSNKSERFDRFVFRADKKNGLTEKQVATNKNVQRIWGCPNLVYEINV